MISIKILRYVLGCVLITILIVISVMKLNSVSSNDSPIKEEIDTTRSESVMDETKIRAVWINYNELSTEDPSKENYEDKIDTMFKTIKSKKYNTAFVQVRPFADAFYNSKYFPQTKYICSGTAYFDPLEIICTCGNRYGISIHAWINPYRVSYDPTYDISLATNGKLMIKTNSEVIFDPSNSEAEALIVSGAKELLSNYDIDGIHIDDYFYPADIGSYDNETYESYKTSGGELDISSWRRSNINRLLRHLYNTVKATNTDLIFSVSPGADINKNYDTYYADVRTWCNTKGYTDWIIPQIYFGYENAAMPFHQTFESWKEITKGTKVKLIIGLPGYKIGITDDFAGAGKEEFLTNGAEIIKKQAAQVSADNSTLGYAVFSYKSINKF